MDRYQDPDAPLHYSYKGINNGLADRYIFRHWWPVAMRAIPARMSANAVSILGSLFCWLAFAILAGLVVGPMADFAPTHPWIFGVAALCVFLYQTLDALDGIQARKTGASGPLGEFVDHWFDSINAFMIPLGLALAFPSIPGAAAALVILLCGMADWTNVRAILKRGVLEFGPISSEEALTLTYLFLLLIWFLGYGFWASPSPVLGFPPAWIIYILAALSFATSIIINLRHSLEELGWLLIALATLLPMAVWIVVSPGMQGPLPILLGGCVLGCAATRLAGDILRERLVGLRYPILYPDFLAIDALLLASLIPSARGWLPLAAVSLSLAWMVFALARQFYRMLHRVRVVTGVRLFRSPARLGVSSKLDTEGLGI
jgi:phosphatidylglycerophosphate synthase